MKKKTDYPTMMDGEWIYPLSAYHLLACCDCGLVHKFEFRRSGSRVKLRAWREKQLTAWRRRKIGVRFREVEK
jgi:hypothetical protein